ARALATSDWHPKTNSWRARARTRRVVRAIENHHERSQAGKPLLGASGGTTMSCIVVRYSSPEGPPSWGVLLGETRVVPLGRHDLSLREFLEQGGAEQAQKVRARDGRGAGAAVALSEVQLVSPVTAPCQLVCQGLNYASHVAESGEDPDSCTFNLLFTKA